MAAVNGKVVFSNDDLYFRKVGLTDAGPLYLALVESTPEVKDPWQDGHLPDGLRFRLISDFFGLIC